MPQTPLQAPQWPDVEPPVAARVYHEIHQLGRTRVDPYAWLKFIPEAGTREMQNLPEALRAHLTAELQYAQEIVRPLEDEVKRLYESMMARVPRNPPPPSPSTKGWQYESRVSPEHGHRVFFRRRPTDTAEDLLDERILLDEGERAQGHVYYRATGHQASPDDQYFAWAEDVRGDDRHQIHVLHIETGELHTIAVCDAFGYGGFTFSPSSQFVFWIWRDACSRPTRLYRSSVDGGEPELVYEEMDPALFMQVARTAANGFVALTLFGPDVSEVRLIPANAETEAPRIVRPRRRGLRYEINEWNDSLLMLTNEGDAPDRQLISIDSADFSLRDVLVPPRPGIPIISIHPFARALARIERVEGLLRLVLRRADGKERVVAFDDPAHTIVLAPEQPYETAHVRIIHQSPATPRRWLDVCLETGRYTEAGREQPQNFDPQDYKLERLYASAPDGESVPITVLSRRDAGEQPQPLLLTGYGAYGIAYEPEFSLPATVLVDAGFRYAIAHVRGGSEKGWYWYQDGCREKKRNSMTDFIACAQYLTETGYAKTGEIVAYGVSAGGLLVSGAMNIAPEQWAGVIAQVPFVDMLNTMSDADHPLVPLLRPDWGDPLADPKAYDHMAALSPYENVRAAPYPPVLCTAGLKDDRVPYWEPAKLVANIRHLSSSGQPAVLHLNPDSGHQESDDRNAEFAQAALLWAFARHCVSGP